MNKIIYTFFLPLLFSCGVIGNYHKEFDDETENQTNAQSDRYKVYKDRFDMYRDDAKQDLKKETTALEERKTLTSNQYTTPSTQSLGQLAPNVQRQYENRKLRVKANDLIDNDNTASLWGGQDPDGFLFTKTNYKKLGDIIQIKVAKNLKDEISLELNKRFPPPPPEEDESKEEGKDGAKEGATKEASAKAEKATGESETSTDPAKIFDSISGLVVEEINKDHLLIRGRKDLLFRSRKRLVEVQALVNRKDVGEDDSVVSNKILESTVTVIR